MSRLAVMSIRIATTDEAGRASAGSISRVMSYHGVIDVSNLTVGPDLAEGATGFLLKGVGGMTAARAGDGPASDTDGTPDQVLVIEGDVEYLPARAGQALSLIDVT